MEDQHNWMFVAWVLSIIVALLVAGLWGYESGFEFARSIYDPDYVEPEEPDDK
jgi:hypothetical protein